jgi:hypothetical protein
MAQFILRRPFDELDRREELSFNQRQFSMSVKGNRYRLNAA